MIFLAFSLAIGSRADRTAMVLPEPVGDSITGFFSSDTRAEMKSIISFWLG